MTVAFTCPCGKALRAESVYVGRWVKCPQCGNSVQVPQAAGAEPAEPVGGAAPPDQAAFGGSATRVPCGLAIASLIISLVGAFFVPVTLCFSPVIVLAICAGVVAIVLGIIARKQIARDPNLTGAGMALAGLIVGITDVALGVIAIGIAVACILFFVTYSRW